MDEDSKKNTIFASLSDVRCENCKKLITKALKYTGYCVCRRCGHKTFLIDFVNVSEEEFINNYNKITEKTG